jgi:heme-degrading monooxygenase HmoA
MEERMSSLIARLWEGSTRASDADRYLEYLRRTGLADYERSAGNRGVLALRRLEGSRADFLLVSIWESESAIRAFAGDPIERARFYPEDDAFLVRREETVRHLELVHPPTLRLR